jgi:hypothetical protein
MVLALVLPDMNIISDSSPQHMESLSAETSSASDPTSSLRAAALLTLKSKRRKSNHPLTGSQARPGPSESSLQLDYGQDEASKNFNAPSGFTATHPSADIEEGQVREEGEISETEEPPLDSRHKKISVLEKIHDSRPPDPSSPTSRSFQYPSLRTGKVKIPDRDQSRLALAQSVPSGSAAQSSGFSVPSPTFVIDAQHVRPGLASMSRFIISDFPCSYRCSDSSAV